MYQAVSARFGFELDSLLERINDHNMTIQHTFVGETGDVRMILEGDKMMPTSRSRYF